MPPTSSPPVPERFRPGPLVAGILVAVLLVLLVVRLSTELQRIPLGTPEPVTTGGALVVKAIDGDTIVLRLDEMGREAHVRLLGVDTPETHRPATPVQCWGPEAAVWTSTHVLGKRVVALPDPVADDVDVYGRLLRVVTVEGESLSLDEQLIQQGFGFAYPQYPFSQNARFVADERVARAQKIGLWNPSNCPEYQSKPLR
jgi:micrococcal nuclease